MEKVPEFVSHWTTELGAHRESLEALSGGINNQVFRCSDGAEKWVIKGYPQVSTGVHDRMQAEVQFLRFAKKAAPGFTPEIIYEDSSRRCIILENIEGTPFREGSVPGADAVEMARIFIQSLNSDREMAKTMITLNACEGFTGLHDHINNIESRLQRMSYLHVERKERRLARLLIDRIHDELGEVKKRTDRAVKTGEITNAIDGSEKCVSPSDFGFHNAIMTRSGVRFIDFEFAGWDDPAKTTSDFALQPRNPTRSYGLSLMAAWKPERRQYIRRRCQYLVPILRLKWICILLSVLTPTRLDRMLTVVPEESRNGLILKRIRNAKLYMELSYSLG
jgi:hypothetical protein